MIAVRLNGVGLIGPGLAAWRDSLPVLLGTAPYHDTAVPARTPNLPASERRRATAVARLALLAAEEAVSAAGDVTATAQTVFASSSGDTQIIDKICNSLAEAGRPVSPIHFHNSVHNAPAGYWGLTVGCTRSSTSLSAYDWSFGSGLLEAVMTSVAEDADVLLVAYDAPPPIPLLEKRPIEAAFAVALLLGAKPGGLVGMHLQLQRGDREDRLSDVGLERLRIGNPAARSLPLLQAVARGKPVSVTIPSAPGWQLRVEVVP